MMRRKEIISEYTDGGCRIVCAGNEYDVNFVRRLKSIILLADHVVANSHGTYIVFCIYLNKPLTIVKDDIDKIHNGYDTETKKIRYMQVEEIEQAFENYCSEITETQRLIKKYWDISKIRSKDELSSLIYRLKQTK